MVMVLFGCKKDNLEPEKISVDLKSQISKADSIYAAKFVINK